MFCVAEKTCSAITFRLHDERGMSLKAWFMFLCFLSCSILLFYYYVIWSLTSRMQFMFGFNLTRAAIEAADVHTAEHVFRADNSSNEDTREIVNRSIIILNLMHEYGKKSRANRTNKVGNQGLTLL